MTQSVPCRLKFGFYRKLLTIEYNDKGRLPDKLLTRCIQYTHEKCLLVTVILKTAR